MFLRSKPNQPQLRQMMAGWFASSVFIIASFLSWRETSAFCHPTRVPRKGWLGRLEHTSQASNKRDDDNHAEVGRSIFLQTMFGTIFTASSAAAFEGGVGGLGKTKPSTGVLLFEESSTPIQNEKGIVSSEIKSISGKPILVEFQTPWPLLPTTSGLEARDLRSSESAFVQIVPLVSDWTDRKVFQQVLIDSVLASKGKYGAYGTPTDVRVKPLNENGIYVVTFTSYTPAMRESERQLYIRPIAVDDSLVMIITGTTRNAFTAQEKIFFKVASSFVAVAAPQSSLRTTK